MQCGAPEAAHTTPGVTLTAEQRELLAQAIADAADYCEARGSDGYCTDCEAAPSGLCPDHEADLDKADSYRALARDFGLEQDR